MKIDCPNCGFSGRVPGYVADAPHHARCPKCRFGFDISDLVARAPALSEPSALTSVSASSPALSPSSSSYEIEALGGVWEDEEEPAPRPALTPTPPAQPLAAAPEPIRDVQLLLLDWRVRLLEGWAVGLLVWAVLIGSRAVFATLVRGDELFFSQALIWPVATVVLLVAAAAGLLLALEFGRRLANGPGALDNVPASTKRRWLPRVKSGVD